MSDPVQLAIIAAITAFVGGLPATIAAYSALQQGRRNMVKANEAALAALEASKGTAQVNEHVGALELKVDGRLTQLIEEMRAKSALEVQVATTTGFGEGQKTAEMTAKVHAADVAIARALPPILPVVPSTHQVDRIEQTGIEVNERVKDVQEKTEQLVAKEKQSS